MGYESVSLPYGSTFLVTSGICFIRPNLCEVILFEGYRVK